MSRLTNEIRESIANECVRVQFTPSVEALKKEEHTLGMKCYREVFDAKTRSAASKMPKDWIRQDGCLMFNCGGYSLTLTVTPPVPVPYSRNCSRLGNITGDLAKECQDYANRKDTAKQEHQNARSKLMTMLGSIGTIKALEKSWPEGKKFYARYLEAKEGSSVPVVQVSEVNAALGLTTTPQGA